jgi:hypothetical protein
MEAVPDLVGVRLRQASGARSNFRTSKTLNPNRSNLGFRVNTALALEGDTWAQDGVDIWSILIRGCQAGAIDQRKREIS